MPNVVEIDGIRALYKMADLLDKEAARELVDAGVRAGQYLVSEAKARAPQETGRLAGSIRPVKRQGGVAVRAGSSRRVPYARGVHFGWPSINVAPNLFMFRAADAVVDRAATEYRDAVIAVWNRVVG